MPEKLQPAPKEPNGNDASSFKIKHYPLGDWHQKKNVSEQEWIDGDVYEQTVLHDVPLAEIFDRETIARLSAQKAQREQPQPPTTPQQ